jgi:hypothetical protein
MTLREFLLKAELGDYDVDICLLQTGHSGDDGEYHYYRDGSPSKLLNELPSSVLNGSIDKWSVVSGTRHDYLRLFVTEK